ncbi:MAG: DUF4037 domain-containing protein [Lachnospiraceae bacterium]|nr:DUF4037 domain-containing protein [Lachnospiraceae bacterium]
MKGLELSEKYYNACGKEVLERDFAEILPHIAVGMVGQGSECLGFDDALSQDHDFEPGFTIFLPGEEVVDRRAEFLLERAYTKLPKEFEGYERNGLKPAGGPRHGVVRLSEFLMKTIGRPDGNLTVRDWFAIPEQSLLEVTDGALFYDGSGVFTGIRERLAKMPEPIRLKKLSACLLMMSQTGQYNYRRLVDRGDERGAQLCVIEFEKQARHAAFLVNHRYMPYYKWSYRALSELPVLSELSDRLYTLISTGNAAQEAVRKAELIDDIAARIICELQDRNLTDAICADLQKHAFSVNDHIADGNIRNMDLFAAL